MAYKRTTWENGVTPINAANLNNIEEGIVEAKTEVRPFEAGGTNANTAAIARQNINFIGTNPIASPEDDTPANWIALGTGIAFISTSGKLKNQPVAYGYLENYTDGTYIYQAIHSLNGKSTVWSRSGTKSDWYTNSAKWVKQLDENNGTQIKKVWQNASLTSQFAAQKISVDLTDYDLIIMTFKSYASYDYKGISAIFTKGDSAVVSFNSTNSGINGANLWPTNRVIESSDNSGITVGKAVYIPVTSGSASINNNSLIPYQIFGVKGVQ